MRYILALIPPKQHFLAYIQAAQNMFSPITDGYLLNEQDSFPHITICAFHCEDRDLDVIWSDLQSSEINICPIRILGLQLKKGNVPLHHYSVGLSVARDLPILQLHEQIVKLLQLREIECLNPSMDLYQPHLTLAGVSWLPDESIILSPIINELISKSVPSFQMALAMEMTMPML